MVSEVSVWVFGLGAMLSLFLIYQQKTRKRLIICKLCADVCWVLHYVCLGAYGGAVPNLVGIFRELVFVNRETKDWAGKRFWPVVFIAANLCLGICTFSRPVNIIPVTASVFVTLSLWCRNPVVTKIISAPVSSAFLVYDILVGSWVGVINESIAILSIIISLIKNSKNMKGRSKNEKRQCS